MHLSRSAGAWQSENLTDTTGARVVSGSAVVYEDQNVVHIVSRAGTDGHLLDMVTPLGASPSMDLTTGAHSTSTFAVPAATYRPAALSTTIAPCNPVK